MSNTFNKFRKIDHVVKRFMAMSADDYLQLHNKVAIAMHTRGNQLIIGENDHNFFNRVLPFSRATRMIKEGLKNGTYSLSDHWVMIDGEDRLHSFNETTATQVQYVAPIAYYMIDHHDEFDVAFFN